MINAKTNSLIATLYDCSTACNHCSTACLEEENLGMMKDCIRIDMDCAAICSLVASFLSRNSPHGKHLLKECAEICRLCAIECGKHQHMQHCADCAAACRKCEEACKAAA